MFNRTAFSKSLRFVHPKFNKNVCCSCWIQPTATTFALKALRIYKRYSPWRAETQLLFASTRKHVDNQMVKLYANSLKVWSFNYFSTQIVRTPVKEGGRSFLKWWSMPDASFNTQCPITWMEIIRTDTQRGVLSGLSRERNLRSKIWWFTEFCNSHYVSHFAAFFIVTRTKISVAKSCSEFRISHYKSKVRFSFLLGWSGVKCGNILSFSCNSYC